MVGSGAAEDPRRPPGVPRTAHYVDRIEDGTWFDCFVDSKRDVDICKAWDDSGRVIADGPFRLEDEDRAATASELHPSLVLSTGGKAYMIYLFGKDGIFGRALVRVDSRNRRIGVPSVTSGRSSIKGTREGSHR
jgi:hypothetical protein